MLLACCVVDQNCFAVANGNGVTQANGNGQVGANGFAHANGNLAQGIALARHEQAAWLAAQQQQPEGEGHPTPLQCNGIKHPNTTLPVFESLALKSPLEAR